MSVWSGLISTRVTRYAEHVIDTGAEVDALLADLDGPRLEVAEVIARALGANGVSLPLTDAQAIAVLADRGEAVAVDLNRSGYLLALADGRVGYSIGGGRVVESRGDKLAVVLDPEPGRYARAFALPGVAYVGE
ncbi:hypothetical protein SEA_ABBA_21 [Arthrobacter phage Abba]|uniref:Uncharacterized protein n=1 Tax=Arthrobacter phage Abba TaxID=2713256 RepID=A0A6G8R2B8_9CAUD|nr:hypothetical protein HYQ28_gp21 [Arthrobacter phage Abba]QIN94350.1 hypothetical protein SEA_ABBA_21 [Arthrobacter phage Abba]